MQLKKYLLPFVTSLFCTILVWQSMVTSVIQGIPFSDASIFEYFGYAMTRGDMMYLNMFDHKGPFVFLINYLGYSLGGAFGIKMLYLLCTFLFFYLTYLIAKLFTGEKQSVLVTVISFFIYQRFFDGGWSLEGFIVPCISYSLLVFLKFFLDKKINKWEMIVSGVMFAIVFFTKANMVGLWVIFCFYALVYCLYLKKYKELITLVTNFFIGVLVVTIPLLIYLYVNGALYDMFYQSILVNLIYTGESNSGSKRAILKWYIEQTNLLQINIAVVISTFFSWREYKLKSVFYHVAFAFCVLLALISKRSYGHYIVVVIPLMIPYLAYFFKVISEKLSFKVFMLAALSLFLIFQSDINTFKESRSKRYRNSSWKQQLVAEYIKENTNESDRIYTHRQNGTIYLYSERLSSTKFFFIPSLTDESPLMPDFEKAMRENMPKYIVFDTEWDYERLTDDYIKKLIKEDYILEKQFDTVSVYKYNK